MIHDSERIMHFDSSHQRYKSMIESEIARNQALNRQNHASQAEIGDSQAANDSEDAFSIEL